MTDSCPSASWTSPRSDEVVTRRWKSGRTASAVFYESVSRFHVLIFNPHLQTAGPRPPDRKYRVRPQDICFAGRAAPHASNFPLWRLLRMKERDGPVSETPGKP